MVAISSAETEIRDNVSRVLWKKTHRTRSTKERGVLGLLQITGEI